MVLGKQHNQKDYEWGVEQEKKCHTYLNEYFETSLERSKVQYARWDFSDSQIKIEMKSRKNLQFNTYPTTFISEDKTRYADNHTYFVFNFVYDYDNDLSDLYCIRYDPTKFKSYKRKKLTNDYSLLEIPVTDLTHIIQETL